MVYTVDEMLQDFEALKIEHVSNLFGEPYYTTEKGSVSSLNEPFWAGLHASHHTELFEPTEKAFYRYCPETGLFREISSDLIKTEISSMILSMARGRHVSSLEAKRSDNALRGIIAHLRGQTERRDAFIKKSNFVHLANGILLFDGENSGVLQPFSPEYCSRNASPISYKEDATCPRFLNELLLPAVKKEDAVLIQKYFGQCLLGKNLVQRILILDGLPGGGKSTLSLVLQKIIGPENVTQLRTKFLAERFELFRFIKKTLLVGIDVPGDFLSTYGASVIKPLVGSDIFDAEKKGSSASFFLQGDFNIVITANTRLRVFLDGDIEAWRRRLLLVRFEGQKPKVKIPNFADILIREEGSGILNWSLEGLGMLLSNIKTTGDIALEPAQAGIVDALLAESDSLRHFLIDCVEIKPGADVTVNELIESYARYCPEKGWSAMPITVIQRDLGKLVLEIFKVAQAHSIKRAGRANRGFRGIGFKGHEKPLEEIKWS